MVVLTVVKPKAVIFDVMNTVIKSGAIEKVLFAYIKENVKEYLQDKWEDDAVKKDVKQLRKQCEKDTSVNEEMPKIAANDAGVEEQKESVAGYVTWCLDHKHNTSAIQSFNLHMWDEGFKDEAKLSTPVYSDVAIKLKKWHFDDGIKFYVYSNGWKDLNKLLLTHTNHGDLTPVITEFYDTQLGSPSEQESYNKLVAKIGEPAESIVYLTKNGAQALVAKQVGINPVLVLTHRKNIDDLTEEQKVFPQVRSFMELEFE